jgi:hypothetical protein
LLASFNHVVMSLCGGRGCHCPLCCIRGTRYLPVSLRTLIKMGSPHQVIKTSCSWCTVTPSLVKIEMVLSSARCPTLINELGKSSNESARAACGERLGRGNAVRCLAMLHSPLATPTRLVEGQRIGRLAWTRSCSLR